VKRKIDIRLEKWKGENHRLPLIVQGARQVGKTYSVLSFGRRCFDSVLYFNFESNSQLQKIFERDLSPQRIIKELSVISGESVFEERSLIFFDEIQACSKALTSLKYFAEDAPGYAVIAAGSLLGVAINRDDSSYPVGKVESVRMYPLDFEEYLWATGQENASDIIRGCFNSFTECSLHKNLLDHYHTYLFTGGLPAVVKKFSESDDPLMAESVKSNINDAYIADMARYAGKPETVKIISVYKSLPAQLAKENHKFQYKVIKSGARVADYASSIDWLKAAGIVLSCNRASEGHIPLSAFTDPSVFKLYHSDVGLLASMSGLTEKILTSEVAAGSGFRGAMAENYVAASLSASGYTLSYWESQGKAEVDFLLNVEGNIIPVEVKSGERVRSRSLSEYINRYSPPFSYRISEKNFGNENNIRSIPFYAVFCI